MNTAKRGRGLMANNAPDSKRKSHPTTAAEKKVWLRPEIKELGRLRELLQAGGAMGKAVTGSDGGGMGGGSERRNP